MIWGQPDKTQEYPLERVWIISTLPLPFLALPPCSILVSPYCGKALQVCCVFACKKEKNRFPVDFVGDPKDITQCMLGSREDSTIMTFAGNVSINLYIYISLLKLYHHTIKKGIFIFLKGSLKTCKERLKFWWCVL